MALTDVQARQAKPRDRAYKMADGGGLYLLVQPNGGRYWRRDYQFAGKRKTAALGIYLAPGADDGAKPAMTLTAARIAANDLRQQVAAGIDPAAAKSGEAARQAIEDEQARQELRRQREAARQLRAEQAARKTVERATLQRVADAWIDSVEAGWTLEHAHQVRQSLEDHVHPKIGRRPIAELDTPDVLDVLSVLLTAGKVETASRVYQRLGAIWEYAILQRQAERDPVRMIARQFTRMKKLALKQKPRRNFAALDRAALPGFLRAMRNYQGDTITRLAMRLLALTFTRTTELRLARWAEFDFESDSPTWVIPVDRMKVKVRGNRQAEPHMVPLSKQAVAVLRELRTISGGELVFPQSRKRGETISENAILYAIWGMGYKDKMTGHGFRAVASTLLHDAKWQHEAIEAQLAHEQADSTAAAYNRADYMETRRDMMQAYADMLDTLEGVMQATVVPFRRTA